MASSHVDKTVLLRCWILMLEFKTRNSALFHCNIYPMPPTYRLEINRNSMKLPRYSESVHNKPETRKKNPFLKQCLQCPLLTKLNTWPPGKEKYLRGLDSFLQRRKIGWIWSSESIIYRWHKNFNEWREKTYIRHRVREILRSKIDSEGNLLGVKDETSSYMYRNIWFLKTSKMPYDLKWINRKNLAAVSESV